MTTLPSQETINEFVIAAHHDLPKVQTLLAEHPDILNENAEWIETAIQGAAHVANHPIIDYLLAQGAPVDICTAALLGRADEVAAFLADNPALKDATGPHGIDIMYYPALGGHIAIAETLLAAGALVNPPGPQSPLIGAILGGHADMVRWLLAQDANPYGTDFEGRDALAVAGVQGFQAAIELLQPFYSDEGDLG
ncbi:MAG: ankyrin repeat domain-containing protein [Chloroflexota bacterium]|nr:ankyrin repeat domain-containing protein [Chloroflexota bacterium]